MVRNALQEPLTKAGTDRGRLFAAADDGSIRTLLLIACLTALTWVINAIWLSLDTRPPVWDMALHQTYAFNYLADEVSTGTRIPFWMLSGVYPPFVHLVIALLYWLVGPGPSVAAWANLPATFLLFWSVAALARQLAGPAAGRWACALTAAVPFLFWMSRETILEYWLSAWVAAALAALLRTEGFANRRYSMLFGCICGLGLLTKWSFVAFMLPPWAYATVAGRVWREPRRQLNFASAWILCGAVAAAWYVPNLSRLVRYVAQNARVGELEGEPPVMSFQSLIYYLRLLEGYQLFLPMFLLLVASLPFVWKRREKGAFAFLGTAIMGAWLVLTVIRTKDPRFTMPLLGPLCVLPGAWIQSLRRPRLSTAFKISLILVLVLQTYMINFGISFLPDEVRLSEGYQGSLRWDWNLYLQHYFHVLGSPLQEDWQQAAVLRKIDQDAAEHGLRRIVGLAPDLPRFNVLNFRLYARLLKLPCETKRVFWTPAGIVPLEEVDYVLITEGDQGMAWTTMHSIELNKQVAQSPDFSHVDSFTLPGGQLARLYRVKRGEAASGPRFPLQYCCRKA